MKYPTLEQVENADRNQLGEWYRFLESPGWSHLNDPDKFYEVMKNEVKIMDRIVDRFKEMGMFTPELSKKIGWEP